MAAVLPQNDPRQQIYNIIGADKLACHAKLHSSCGFTNDLASKLKEAANNKFSHDST